MLTLGAMVTLVTAMIDPRWGTSRGYLDEILKRAGQPCETLHDCRDVLFGGQTPDCSEPNLRELSVRVTEGGFDLGIATDGDGDRFAIIDGDGHYVAPNLILALVADYLGNPTSSLVTVRCAPWYHRDTVVLAGDAAHAVVPFYGQGINAGFEDCVLLADTLKEHGSDRERALATYYQGRKIHADAIADLAITNFLEMRDHVASTRFRMKKRIERTLHRLLPRWYTPLYNLVSFTLIPYAEAVRRTRRAKRVVRIAVAVLVLLVLATAWVLR